MNEYYLRVKWSSLSTPLYGRDVEYLLDWLKREIRIVGKLDLVKSFVIEHMRRNGYAPHKTELFVWKDGVLYDGRNSFYAPTIDLAIVIIEETYLCVTTTKN